MAQAGEPPRGAPPLGTSSTVEDKVLREVAASNDPLSELRDEVQRIKQEINPFEYSSPPGMWEVFKLAFFTISLLAVVRVVAFLTLLAVVLVLCLVATAGLDPRQATVQPYAPWRRAILAPVAWLCRAALFVFGFYHIEVVGRPDPRAAFIVPNHCSLFDALVLYWLTRPAPVAKAEVFKVPVLGRVFRALQVIPVKRESKEAREETKSTITRFAESQALPAGQRFPQVLIFPQGTTTKNKVLTMFQRGAFLPGLAVQPVALDYSANKYFDPSYVVCRKKDLFHRRHLTQFWMRLKVTFLPLHIPTQAEKADPTLFANNVRREIATALGDDVVMTDHYFEDAKLYKEALDIKEEKHVVSLLETPSASDKVSMGNLQLKEVKDIFARDASYGLPEVKHALRVFQRIDANGDGTIDFDEFCRALGLNRESDHARLIFDFIDRDHTGSIDFRELVLSMAICCEGASTSQEEKARFAFDLYDGNHDGVISEDEFFDLLAHTRGGSFRVDDSLRREVRDFEEAAAKHGAPKDDAGRRLVSWPLFRELVKEHPSFVQSAILHFQSEAFPMTLETLRAQESVAREAKKTR